MKKKLITALQLLLAVGILAAVFVRLQKQGELGRIAEAWNAAASHWPLLVAALVMYLLCLVVVSFRWQVILSAQGFRLPFLRVFALYFIGQFFSSFLPGATSGDVVKAYYATREMPDRKTEAASTVFIDRVMGLLALFVLCVAIMAFRLDFFLAYPQTRTTLVAILILLAMTAFAILVVFRHNLLERWSFFRRLEQRTPLGEMIGRVYNVFRLCLGHPVLLTKTILLSILNHTLFVVCAYFLGLAVEVRIPFMSYLSVFPIVNGISAIPITPGGLGTRDAAAIWLLEIFSVPAAKAVTITLLVYATLLFWSLVGGVVYVIYSCGQPKLPPAPRDADGSLSEAT